MRKNTGIIVFIKGGQKLIQSKYMSRNWENSMTFKVDKNSIFIKYLKARIAVKRKGYEQLSYYKLDGN